MTTYQQTQKLESVITFLHFNEVKHEATEIIKKTMEGKQFPTYIKPSDVLEAYIKTLEKVAVILAEIEGNPETPEETKAREAYEKLDPNQKEATRIISKLYNHGSANDE